jgi:hypothetical protein
VEYKITYFANFHDTCVEVHDSIEWEEMVSLFSEHTLTENKDGMMFNLCSFKDRDGIRCADNVDSYYGLVLDYDGHGATLEGIVDRFLSFTHLGYTSFNHVIKGVDKMRVVLPFTTPCPKDEWESRKAGFLEFAGIEIDKSCISHSRSFYMPACPAAGVEHKLAWNVKGEWLDWTVFEPEVKPAYVPPALTFTTTPTDMQRALDELFRHVPVMDNEGRYWLVRAVAREIGETAAIAECQKRWPDANWNGKYIDQVKRLTENGPGMGAIINKIKKFNPTYKAITKDDYRLAVLKANIKVIEEKLKELENE